MDQQEQAFLSAALGVGDERLERRMLVGFHLIRDCCRLADDPAWVPRTRVAREALEGALADGAFADGEQELAAVRRLLETLETPAPQRRDVHSALVGYTTALYREARLPATEVAVEILEQLWDPTCRPRDRLYGAYFQGLAFIRGSRPREISRYLPIALALLARAEGEAELVALAESLQQVRVLLSGNLPLTISLGEKRLRQLHAHPSVRAEGQFVHQMAAAHGRAGRPEETLRLASTLLQDRFLDSAIFGALGLIGTAFMELGNLDAARATFELMLLAPYANHRRIGVLGLMDVHVRRLEREPFERIYRQLVDAPFSVESRVYFLEAAGRGWTNFGEIAQARACFDRAYDIATKYGLGYEIFEMEACIDKLPAAGESLPASDIVEGVAAQVAALRDSRADEIASCLP